MTETQIQPDTVPPAQQPPFVQNSTVEQGVPSESRSRAVFMTGGVTEIKGPSRLEYVPYQRTIIQYEPVETIECIPRERKIIEYEERTRVEQVPVEEVFTDYYAVEHVTEYIPQVIPETKIEYVPVERTENRVEYYPIEREVVRYHNQIEEITRTDYYQSHVQREHPLQTPVYGPQSYVQPSPQGYKHRLEETPNFHFQPAPFQRPNFGVAPPISVVKKTEYVSPLDYTRENISPRVSAVSGYSQRQDYSLSEKESHRRQRPQQEQATRAKYSHRHKDHRKSKLN